MASPDAFTKRFRLNKLLSTTSDEILKSKSEKILNVFIDDVQTILKAFTYCPFLLSDKRFNELINILTPKQQTQAMNEDNEDNEDDIKRLNITDLCDDELSYIFQFLPIESLIQMELTSLRFMYVARSKNVIQLINENNIKKMFIHHIYHSNIQCSIFFDRFKNIKKYEFLNKEICDVVDRAQEYRDFVQQFMRFTVCTSSSYLTHLSINKDEWIIEPIIESNVKLNNLLSLKILYDEDGERAWFNEKESNLILSKAPNIKTLECQFLYRSNLKYLSKIETLGVEGDLSFYDDRNEDISDEYIVSMMMPNIKTLKCDKISMSEHSIKCISNLESLTCNQFELPFIHEDDIDIDDDDNDDIDDDDDDDELNKKGFYKKYIAANTNQKPSLQYFKYSDCGDDDSLFVASCIVKENCNTLQSLYVNTAFFEQLHEYLYPFINNNTIIPLHELKELSVELSTSSNNNVIASTPNLKKLCIYRDKYDDDASLHEFYESFIKNNDFTLEFLEIYDPSHNVLNEIFNQIIPNIIAKKKDKYKKTPFNVNIVFGLEGINMFEPKKMREYIKILKAINESDLYCKMQFQLKINLKSFGLGDRLKKPLETVFAKWNCNNYEWDDKGCYVRAY